MTVSHRFTFVRIACLLLLGGLGACSSTDGPLGGGTIDYKSGGTTREQGLDVPPDLSQLQRDPRLQPSGGSVSAAEFQAGAAARMPATSAAAVAPKVGDMRIERAGNERWLATPIPPEQLWPQLQAFWKESGFALVLEQPEAGVMETGWAENRAKLPQDIVRRTIGRVFDSLYSTGELDKFRTRIERTANGSEIYVSHRRMTEEYQGALKETTVWQPQPADVQLEAAMLQRIMVKLGAEEEEAQTAAAAATSPAAAPRARIMADQPAATLQVDDAFDRAWRRVGLALDRSGFTVEDRDRAQGLYFVRYVDPSTAGKDEPGFLSKLFSLGGSKDEPGGPVRYRVSVKGQGDSTTVTVLNAQGGPESGEAAQRIVTLLLEDLK